MIIITYVISRICYQAKYATSGHMKILSPI